MCPANECQERVRISDKPYQLAHVVTCSKAIIYHSSQHHQRHFSTLVFRDISLYSASVQCNIPLESSQSVSVSGDTKKRRATERYQEKEEKESETRLDMDSYCLLFSLRIASSSSLSSRTQETDIIFGCVIRMRNNEVNGFQFEIKLIFIEFDSVRVNLRYVCVCLDVDMDESLLCVDCELP